MEDVMDDTQIAIKRLKNMVDTARQEIELAIMFHETWRPAAYDTGLHDRIGTSYAAHAFQIIWMSLRRELLLALTRLWDSNKQAVRMSLIADRLRDARFFEALVLYRARRLGSCFVSEPAPVRDALTPKRDLILSLINKYSEGGSASEVLKKLKTLRHERLAHRQLPNTPLAVAKVEMSEQQGEGGERPVWATDD